MSYDKVKKVTSVVASQFREAGASGAPLTVYQILFSATCVHELPFVVEFSRAETSTNVVLLPLPSEYTEQYVTNFLSKSY